MYHYQHIPSLENSRIRSISDAELLSLSPNPNAYFDQKLTILRWWHTDDITGIDDNWWPETEEVIARRKLLEDRDTKTQIYWDTIKIPSCKSDYSVVSLDSNKK